MGGSGAHPGARNPRFLKRLGAGFKNLWGETQGILILNRGEGLHSNARGPWPRIRYRIYAEWAAQVAGFGSPHSGYHPNAVVIAGPNQRGSSQTGSE